MSALVCAQCAPVSRLPQLPQDEILAEQRLEQLAHIRAYYAELHRVDNIAFRIRTANVADCGENVAAQIGLYAVTPQSLPRRYRSYSREALDITWARPTVISVAEGSPAAQADIVKGDEITALNGELIPLTGTADWMRRWLTRNGVKPLEANIRRGGDDRTITITPVQGCAIPIAYVTEDDINASTDGHIIQVSSAIADICKTDAQLAAIIGHELAHANLGHMKKRQVNMWLAAAGGVAVDGSFALGGIATNGAFMREFAQAGSLAFSVDFEREADYVGAYYMARAGYDVTGAEEVWRAMALKHPANILKASTHPISAVRFLQMQKVAREIADKKTRGEALVPNLRTASQPTSDASVQAAAE